MKSLEYYVQVCGISSIINFPWAVHLRSNACLIDQVNLVLDNAHYYFSNLVFYLYKDCVHWWEHSTYTQLCRTPEANGIRVQTYPPSPLSNGDYIWTHHMHPIDAKLHNTKRGRGTTIYLCTNGYLLVPSFSTILSPWKSLCPPLRMPTHKHEHLQTTHTYRGWKCLEHAPINQLIN